MAALTDFLNYLDSKLTQVDTLEKDKKDLQNVVNGLYQKIEDSQTMSEELGKTLNNLTTIVNEQKQTLISIQEMITNSQKNYEEFAAFVKNRLEKESSLRLER